MSRVKLFAKTERERKRRARRDRAHGAPAAGEEADGLIIINRLILAFAWTNNTFIN
jgi:hypothetical protein